MRMITVSVEYGDLLAITLPRNARHFEKVVVVTAAHDEETLRVVASIPNAVPYVTDAFYRGGVFNKGWALSEGLEFLGDGWVTVMDADTLLHPGVSWGNLEIGNLYTPKRYMLRNILQWKEYVDSPEKWLQLELEEAVEFAGYCQIYHTSDPALVGKPRYPSRWKHAGGCDSEHQGRWPSERKIRPPFVCLHIGEDRKSWCGRATMRTDGTIPPPAAARQETLRRFKAGRRKGPDRFKGEKL